MATSITSSLDQIVLFPTRPITPTKPVPPTIVKIAKPASVLARVIEEKVNVRAAPNLQAAVVSQLARGAQVMLFERSQDGKWYRIQSDDETQRWVIGNALEITSGDPEILPRVSTHP
ncbi:MAG: SH3 domain-containing protein [Chloroflexi bacterium]|nr:SH3 domain-containing protein [Chloroflexota bacterium]